MRKTRVALTAWLNPDLPPVVAAAEARHGTIALSDADLALLRALCDQVVTASKAGDAG